MKKVLTISIGIIMMCTLLFGCGEQSASKPEGDKIKTQQVSIEEITFEIPDAWVLDSDNSDDKQITRVFNIDDNSYFFVSYFKSYSVDDMISVFEGSPDLFQNFEITEEYKVNNISTTKCSYVEDGNNVLGYLVDFPNGAMRFVGVNKSSDFDQTIIEDILHSVVVSETQESDDSSDMAIKQNDTNSLYKEIQDIIEEPFTSIEFDEVAVDEEKPDELTLYVYLNAEIIDQDTAEKLMTYCSKCVQNTSFSDSDYCSIAFALNDTMAMISVFKDGDELWSSIYCLGSDSNTKSILESAYQSNEFLSYIDSENSYQRSLDDIREKYGLTD